MPLKLTDLILPSSCEEPESRVVVRLRTQWYARGSEYCQTVSIRPLQKYCRGHDWLSEEISNGSLEDTLALIEDLNGLTDGLYEAIGRWSDCGNKWVGETDITLDKITLTPFNPEGT